jgi:metal-dependent amidase/aminoacylase/carboxypeptidase family protein
MVAKDFNGDVPVIFNVGSMHGGDANNIICDYAYMYCTLRTHDDAVAEYALNKIKKIINAIAETSEGRAEFTPKKHYPKVTNNKIVTERVRKAAEQVIGVDNILPKRRGMGGEDFSYFARLKPGCMYHLGIANKERGITSPVHTVKFDIDESSLEVGVNIFKRFILDNMHGIDFSDADKTDENSKVEYSNEAI